MDSQTTDRQPASPLRSGMVPRTSLLPLWRSIGHEFATRAQKWGLPLNAGRVLMHLLMHPENGEPALLAEETHFPRQTMTFVLDALESNALAVRQPHLRDRRRKRVILTDAGRALASQMLDDLLAFESEALAAIPAGERESFHALVERYADALVRQNRTATAH